MQNIPEYLQEIERDKKKYIEYKVKKEIGEHFINCTLENFKTTDLLKPIVAEIQNYIKNIEENIKTGKGLFLVGSRGLGKTHLAGCIFRAGLEKSFECKYIKVLDLMRMIKKSYSNNNTDYLINNELVKDMDLLILEEVGKSYGSEDELINFVDILDKRYSHNMATILITNLDIKTVEVYISSDVISRINETYKILFFRGSDYRRSHE